MTHADNIEVCAGHARPAVRQVASAAEHEHVTVNAVGSVRGRAPAAGLYVVGQRFQHRGYVEVVDGVHPDVARAAWPIARGRRGHLRAAG